VTTSETAPLAASAEVGMELSLVFDNLLTPPSLFFLLGVLATLLRSDLEIPSPVTKALSIYLLFSIGLHGGAELSHARLDLSTLSPLLIGVASSALFPVAVFALLRRRLGAANAAGVAASYGSISAVTFITAASFLDDRGLSWSGHMVAAMALMESPAVLVALVLARRAGAGDAGSEGARSGALFREALLSGPVFLLLGSLAIGAAAGEKGWQAVAPFADAPFKGALCLFLLDMGQIAARRLGDLRGARGPLVTFAVVAPLAQGCLAVLVARLLDLPTGDALLLAVLCGSASYIAVPAALRLTLPEANPSIYLPMALGITFPLNVSVGIPIYLTLLQSLGSTP